MTRRPERNFYEQLKRNLPKCGWPLDLVRVENTAGVGHPDVNYCVAGAEGHVELKAWERVRLTGRLTIPKLREDQAVWLNRRASVGGRAYLLCRINRDVVLFDGRLVPSFFNKQLHLDWQLGVDVATAWLRPPIDWGQLASKLAAEPLNELMIKQLRSLFVVRPTR